MKRGWAEEVDEDVLEEWRNVGTGKEEELEKLVLGEFKAEYKRLFSEVSDLALNLIEECIAEFHSFRSALAFSPNKMTTYQRSSTLSSQS